MEADDQLVATHGPAVWKTIVWLLGSSDGAADCFQETFTQFVVLARRQNIVEPAGVLVRIATRRAIDEIRRRVAERRRRQPLIDQRPADQPSPADFAAGRELSDLLREALGQIPDDQAAVFCLTQLDDFDNAAVAGVLGITPNHVGVLLHRARKQLQQRLASYVRPQTR
jgi:RNA polymerase sigma-70 factor, ECF subfamily